MPPLIYIHFMLHYTVNHFLQGNTFLFRQNNLGNENVIKNKKSHDITLPWFDYRLNSVYYGLKYQNRVFYILVFLEQSR